MLDAILNAVPEEKRAEIQSHLDKLIDLDAMTAEQFADLRKSHKVVKSLFESELGTMNEKYRQEKVPALVDKMVSDKMAAMNPETDPDKIKARLDNETDPAKRRDLERDLRIAMLEKNVANSEAEKRQLQEIAETAKRKDILKSYITEKGYEGIEIDPFAALDIELAQKTIDSIAQGVTKFKSDLVERYKGSGNPAPGVGAQPPSNKSIVNSAIKQRDWIGALRAAEQQ